MKVERCMTDNKKTKILRRDHCKKGSSGSKGDERRGEDRRQAPDIQQRGNFKTRSLNPSKFKTSYGRFQRQNIGQERGGTSVWIENVPQRRPAKGQNPNFEERNGFQKSFFSCGQPRHFSKYCPNVGTQGSLRTISQSIN